MEKHHAGFNTHNFLNDSQKHQAMQRISFLTITLLVSLFFIFSFASSSVKAHEIRPAIVDFTFDNNGLYQLTIQHNLEALLAEIGSAHDETEESENSKKYDELRALTPEKLNTEFENFTPKFLENMHLLFNGEKQSLQILDVNIPEVGDLELARDSTINITGILPENVESMSWKWSETFGNAVLRVSSDSEPDLFNSYLVNGDESEQVPVSGPISQSKWDVFKNYIKVGFVHIIPKGLDHILFVVGLFLLSAKLKPLLIQVTTFTLAHSVTLALGIFGIITLTDKHMEWVEALIAASIVYVCIENIYSNKLNRWRPLIIFGFGLLHGLGFASVLGDVGLDSGSFVTGLIGFNIGVEIGQLTVVAVCFLAVGLWFRNKPWYRKVITIPASIIIALIAIYWVLERTGVIA